MTYSVDEINVLSNSDDIFDDLGYFSQVEKISSEILNKINEKPVILINGPSGAGKTTLTKNIVKRLNEKGKKCYYISMDNYFYSIDPEEYANGASPDYEYPLRVEFPLLNEHIKKLLNYETINMPTFDFSFSKRSDKTIEIKREKDSLIFIEGIHSFNTDYLNTEHALKVYVDLFDEVQCGRGKIGSRQIRLLRRISRDYLTRGRKFSQTINQFENVSEGEDLYITPFLKDVDFSVNSFLPYELGCYKTALYKKINEIDEEKLNEIKCVLNGIEEVSLNKIKEFSPIKEFIK